MYLMEHPDEGARMENRDLDEARDHLERAGLRAGDRVLDAGCASGLLTRMMASIVAPGTVTGVDLSEERISRARSRADEARLDGIEFKVGDLHELPFSADTFDCAFSRYTFEYLNRPGTALRELKRVTRPSGRVVVADLDGNGMFHYPVPARIEGALHQLFGALGKAGFDPFIGRKLYNLFYREGFRRTEVQVLPHHLIAGKATPDQIENWMIKLETIRPHATKAFPSEAAYDGFVTECMELLTREDTLTYSVTFLVIGVV